MAAVILRGRRRQTIRRNRILRDRTHPFEIFDDVELYRKFRFRRQDIIDITDEICNDIKLVNRHGTLPPLLQVMTALRFYASGSFQDVCGELIGIHQSTASRAITRVTDALLRKVPNCVMMPTQEEAENSKKKFFLRNGFPNAIGAIDGTQIRIQAPVEQEHEFVNRKNFHSINVQVICDADLLFWNCIAKWPGSVHDARILRESELFQQFEGNNKPLRGFILGDSGYMQRDWLMAPVANPVTQQEIAYNFHHSSARTAVERAIGVLKRRWHCLRRLRLEPAKACKVITVCVMLHNRATVLNLDPPSDSEDDNDEEDGSDDDDDEDHPLPHTERARRAAGGAVRAQLIHNYFT